MPNVTIRELCRRVDEVIGRVETGEQLTITRAGRPIAELRPVRRHPASAATLLERWSTLPRINPAVLRRDLDERVDSSL